MPKYKIDQKKFRKESNYGCYLKRITQRKVTAETRQEAAWQYKKEAEKHALEIWDGMFQEIKERIKLFDNDSADKDDRAYISMVLHLPEPDTIKEELTRTIYESLEVQK